MNRSGTRLVKPDKNFESPCIRVCQIHTVEGLDHCVGCYRTMDEIKWWSEFEPHIQAYIVEQCHNRRNLLHPKMGFKTNEDPEDNI